MLRTLIRILGCVAFLVSGIAHATSLNMIPQNANIKVGDTLLYDLMANIDPDDAVMGFGFDLSLDGGQTFASGPGAAGSAIIFNSFTTNSDLGFNYDPFFVRDSDTISGFLGIFDPDVFGPSVKLGTFSFTAFSSGSEIITISADDHGTPFSYEGLVPGFSALRTDSFLPNDVTVTVNASSVNIVPEPTSCLLMGCGVLFGIVTRRLSKR